jgi:uncharacterized protein YbaP (TraB family)
MAGAAFVLACLTWPLAANSSDAPAAEKPALEQELAGVLVTGEQPGPGLWRVSSHGNELWVLGTLSPLPAGMQWRSAQAEAVIARSRQVLAPPSVSINIGFFKSLTLIPALLKARKSPDGRQLPELLSPELYARWRSLKQRYLPNSDGVEKHRPIVAAQELYAKALEKSGLKSGEEIWERVQQAAKRHDVAVVPVTVSPTLKDPKETIQQLQQIALQREVDCFTATLDRIEKDLPSMQQRANHWATGDVAALRVMPQTDQRVTCFDSVASVPSLREQLHKTRDQINDLWVAAAQTALANSPTTFAVLPMDQILQPTGLLAKLKARGYEVQEPK